MMTVDAPVDRHPTTTRVAGNWVVVIRRAPLRLGHLVRLEHGEQFRAPFPLMILGRKVAWWWRPTFYSALAKGFREALS